MDGGVGWGPGEAGAASRLRGKRSDAAGRLAASRVASLRNTRRVDFFITAGPANWGGGWLTARALRVMARAEVGHKAARECTKKTIRTVFYHG